MKIKTVQKSYAEVMAKTPAKRKKPKRPNLFFRCLLKLVSLPDLWAVKLQCRRIGMERLGKREPCLFLMNHSSFVDLEIAASILFPRPFNIVATTDGFVGKDWLMRQIGCIPTKKFVTDLGLIRDISHAVKALGNSVLMYPEASYSFDGTATPLPESLGKFIQTLGVPVVMIRTYGAFTRDPLYNNLQRRRTKVTADMEYLLSADEIKNMRAEDINALLKEKFTFDHFRWQEENKVCVKENFRADYLHRVLYKCPHCMTEGKMLGKGISLRCDACGKEYTLDEYGVLSAADGDGAFSFVTDWYAWERECVRKELEDGSYLLDTAVDVCMSIDTKAIYRVGEGHLTHDENGFLLCGEDWKYAHSPVSSYSLYSDFNWYEIGDMICIGNHKALYYCFPKGQSVSVAKARLAAEELYKMAQSERRGRAAKTTV